MADTHTAKGQQQLVLGLALIAVVLAVGLVVLLFVRKSDADTNPNHDSKEEVNGCTIEPGTECEGADLRSANLSGVDLSGADLANADLTEANLTEADLSSADLSGATLESANLSQANLSHANISGANFTGANLTGTNLSGATYDDDTSFDNTIRCNTTRADGSTDDASCEEGGGSTPPSSAPQTTTTTTGGGGGGGSTTTTTSGGGGGTGVCSSTALAQAYNASGASPQIPQDQFGLVGYACGAPGDEWAVARLGSTSWVSERASGGWSVKATGTGRLCEGGIPSDLCSSLWDEIPGS